MIQSRETDAKSLRSQLAIGPVAERLLPGYFRRWLRNPLSIDPQTKMPVYFDEGKSPLTETLDGDAEQQIEALWQYLRLGTQMGAEH